MYSYSKISSDILLGKARGTETITLEQFKGLYREVVRLADESEIKVGETVILLLTKKAVIQFSTSGKYFLIVNNNRNLSRSDFDVVIHPVFEGNIKPITRSAFIWTEIKENWYILIPLAAMFYLLTNLDDSYEILQIINPMIVEANALFIGIFVLFTISQNKQLLTSPGLVKKGITHQLLQNDFYITKLAIVSLLSAIISTVISKKGWFKDLALILFNRKSSLDLDWLPYALTTFSIILLVDCFLAVTRYYIKVMRTAMEAKMYRDLMGKNLTDEE